MAGLSPLDPSGNVNSVASASSATSASSTTNEVADFGRYPDEDYYTGQAVKKETTDFIKKHKGSMKLDDSWYHFIIGEDHITYTPKGKITYGQLRDQLNIPPKVLSETNKKKLKDDQVIQGSVRINLSDIGWYPQTGLSSAEQAVNRNLRANGVPTAGYDRAVTDDDIIDCFK